MKELVSIEYKVWLESLKNKFRTSQIKASIKVNTTLLEFYWDLGEQIVQNKKHMHWGSGFLEKLSHDLSAEFPDIKGFSRRNLEHIRQWYQFWQQAVSANGIWKYETSCFANTNDTWGHNIAIIQNAKT